MKGRGFEEEDNGFEDEEIPEEGGFDLRNKSLKNTAKREAEPRKAVLPLKSVMKEILDKPLNELAQKVRASKREIDSFFKKEGHPEECREREKECQTGSY